MGIEEDEADDLVFEDEPNAPKEGIKWVTFSRVHSSNYFSSQTLEQHMKTLESSKGGLIHYP
jgi:hypothetical protein